MKKAFAVLMAVVLMFALASGALADSDKANGNNGNGSEKSHVQQELKKELNEQKKEINRQKAELEAQMEDLQAQYDELIVSGDTAGAEAILAEMEELETQIGELQTQMKQIINERYMIIKSTYTEEELAQFENAAAVIEQMYEDVYALELGSVSVNGNVIKFDTPPYIKGGKVIIPVKAVTEELGAEVVWNEEDQSVTITKDNIVVIITINSTTVLVDGVETEMDEPAAINCGRTYMTMDSLAQIFGLEVTWDEENEIADIEDEDEGESEEPEDGDDEGTEDPEDGSDD